MLSQLVGREPIIIMTIVLAAIQAVDWTQIHVQWVQIVVSAVTSILVVLVGRSQVTPVGVGYSPKSAGHPNPEAP